MPNVTNATNLTAPSTDGGGPIVEALMKIAHHLYGAINAFSELWYNVIPWILAQFGLTLPKEAVLLIGDLLAWLAVFMFLRRFPLMSLRRAFLLATFVFAALGVLNLAGIHPEIWLHEAAEGGGAG